jgi:hypothetical protein
MLVLIQMASEGEARQKAASVGPNLEPLKRYLEAQRLHAEGKDAEALVELSRAMGSEKPLTRLEGNLDKVFDSSQPLSEITLHLALTETKKRRTI